MPLDYNWNSYSGKSLEFSTCKIIWCVHRDNFTPFFPIQMSLFLFLAYLLWLGLSNTMLNRSGKKALLSYSRYQRISFQPVTVESSISGLDIQLSLWVGMFLPHPVYWEFLSWKGVEFIKHFSCIYWDDQRMLLLLSH